jgi:hypothetical protein
MMIAPNTWIAPNIKFISMQEGYDFADDETVRRYLFKKDGKKAAILIYSSEELIEEPLTRNALNWESAIREIMTMRYHRTARDVAKRHARMLKGKHGLRRPK